MLMVTPSQLWSEPHGILVEKNPVKPPPEKDYSLPRAPIMTLMRGHRSPH